MSYSASLDPEDGPIDQAAPSGGNEAVRWEVVAHTPGLVPARIIADSLIAEGIPARAWQESAGQAIGLVIGPMGTGYVEVPEQFVEQALDLLDWDEEE